ncbi:hypothetical protein [Cohnella candidum]|uniref:hypothetical protein n=1 Tax=Cohnella candidum TaxID=2674991 RepID=UPI0013DDF413|nr:hypothetical protein [Cohnella candidum]
MERFYCVKCGRLTGIEQAESLFKTGYFRIEHRLGCCKACESEAGLHGHSNVTLDGNPAHTVSPFS